MSFQSIYFSLSDLSFFKKKYKYLKRLQEMSAFLLLTFSLIGGVHKARMTDDVAGFRIANKVSTQPKRYFLIQIFCN